MFDILISTYNGEKYLEEQLNSIISQSFKNWRILIRDDGSTDKTVIIINKFIKKYPKKIIFIDNYGINLGSSKAFLLLLKISSSNLILFCDQDDLWNVNKLNTLYQFYNCQCNIEKPVLIHSYVDVVDENLNPLNEKTFLFNKIKGLHSSLKWSVFQNDVTGCTVLVNDKMRDLFHTINVETLEIIQHDWFLAIIATIYEAKYLCKEKLIQYRQHSNNSIGINIDVFSKRLVRKLRVGFHYPYYAQIDSLLRMPLTFSSIQEKKLLEDFVAIKKKTKISRILWHIKMNFFREGNFFYKIYQLFIC